MIGGALAALAGALLAPGAAATAQPATTSLKQVAVVDWQNGQHRGHDRQGFTLPGIGSGEIVCRPDAAFIRMRPYDPWAETTMWSTLIQTKGGVTYPAVHNARVYRFSTPTSPVPRGTGEQAHEGLNQTRPLEASSRGTAFGLISQRSARNELGLGTAPATSFELRWRWSGFGGSTPECRVNATLLTRLPEGATVRRRTLARLTRMPGPAASDLNLAWHGDADAVGKDVSGLITLPYLGVLAAGCPAGPDAPAALAMRADVADDGPLAVVVTYEGEGPDADTRSHYVTDSLTGLLGPIPLPVNGMMTLRIRDAEHRVEVIASSVRKTNDPDGGDNLCEVAVQAVNDPFPP